MAVNPAQGAQPLVAYVDESYTSDFYYLGAAIGEQAQWQHLSKLYANIRQISAGHYLTAIDVEFHAHRIFGGRGEWGCLHGKHWAKGNLYAALLRAGSEAGIRYIFEGVDIAKLHTR